MCLQPKSIYLLNPLKSSPEIRGTIDSFQDEWLEMHILKKPCLLYHYTTLNGLKGILESRSLWFSHISSFNDPSELHYGKRVVVTKLNEALGKEDSEDIKRLLTRLTSYIEAFDKVLYHIYVACFCEDDNLLSQWRGYAAFGGGYNVGISFDSDAKFSHNSDNLSEESHIILRKIIYDPTTQLEIVTKCVDKIIEGCKNAAKSIEDHGKNQFDTWIDQAALESTNILFDIILSLKNEAFSQENEWRLIKVIKARHKPELLKFREDNQNLIPYLHTYIYKRIGKDETLEFPMRTLRFGPMLDDASTKPSLELLIHNHATSENPITISPIGVRILDAGFRLRN